MKRTIKQLEAAGFKVDYIPEGLVKISRDAPFYVVNTLFPVTIDRMLAQEIRWELITPVPEHELEFAFVLIEVAPVEQLKHMQVRINADRAAIATLHTSIGKRVTEQTNLIVGMLG